MNNAADSAALSELLELETWHENTGLPIVSLRRNGGRARLHLLVRLGDGLAGYRPGADDVLGGRSEHWQDLTV